MILAASPVDTLNPVGMVGVFVLIAIVVAFMVARRSSVSPQAANSAKSTVTPEAQQQVKEESPMQQETVLTDDYEMIAVIAAALAAYTGRKASDIRVSSIRRLVSVETGWAAQARNDLIDSRRVLS